MSSPTGAGHLAEFFPLDADRVERSMAEVREDPEHALIQVEATYIEFNNPNLNILLNSGVISVSNEDRGKVSGYLEGATLTYKLAREAGTPDGVLPTLSTEGGKFLAGRMIATLTEAQSQTSHGGEHDETTGMLVSAIAVMRRAYSSDLESEPDILELIKGLADHRLDRDAYYLAASTVVAGLRRAMTEQYFSL